MQGSRLPRMVICLAPPCSWVARICDKADNDGIFVSSVVRELSAGSKVKFEDKGTFELKGVEEDPTLYGVTLEE